MQNMNRHSRSCRGDTVQSYYYEEGTIGILGIDRQDYIDRMYEWQNNDHLTMYMVTGLQPSNRERLEQDYLAIINNENVVFAVKDKKSGRTIGFAGLYSINQLFRHAELRIILGDEQSQGKGVGTIVTRFLLRYGFEKRNLNKIWLGVNAQNSAAIRCYEKAGFVKEGVLRDELFRNNRYYDALRMSVLRKDYERKTA
jgi:RimJ/RimL family protein N-acetyltransferase